MNWASNKDVCYGELMLFSSWLFNCCPSETIVILKDSTIRYGAKGFISMYGRNFALYTDHKPCKLLPQMASAIRWRWGQGLEEKVKSCDTCQSKSNKSPPQPLVQSCQWPYKLWARIHIHFAGLYVFNNHWFLH